MSEKNERPKPPARRTSGRPLGGAKKTTPPPPPPVAELTPEQFAAEQAAAQGEGRPAASEPQAQPAVSIGVSTQDLTEMMAEVAQEPAAPPAHPRVEAAPGSPVQDPAASQPARPAVVASEAGTESPVASMEWQALGQTVAPAAQPSAPAAQPTPLAEHVSQQGASQDTGAAPGVAHTAEVAIHSTVLPVMGAAAFPVSAGAASPQHEQQAGSDTAPSNGTSWEHGSGRPKKRHPGSGGRPQSAHHRAREPRLLVPAALKLKRRIKRFALDNELDHLPMGDIVSVALDEWLTTRGF
ncbi:hypothetical protein [Streptomyces sasae]|uniref:hypothetical protein n=1 Tax=Streptomyces sasae TaxID=1266772 RepID=UPI00292EB4C0|nr:hypothetical protein [Streptomyces sasae]